jgi:hypothetical protein
MGYHGIVEAVFAGALGPDVEEPEEVAAGMRKLLERHLEQAGYCIAPLEPTREMEDEAAACFDDTAAYKAMISARPKE